MKKILIALSSVILIAFFVIYVANAQNRVQEVKKSATEVSKDCGKCASTPCCAKMAQKADATAAKKCDTARCKEMGCDPAKCKEGCELAKCKAGCKQATAEGKAGPQAKGKMLTNK